jgi:hypothetical protein
MYDPRVGRHIQVEPVRNNIPNDHYIYAGNCPISLADPSGLTKEQRDRAQWALTYDAYATEEHKKYLQWIIYSDEMQESLWGKGDRSETQQ